MKLPDNIVLDQTDSAPIVQIDDDEMLLKIVERYYTKSGLSNPYIAFTEGDDFINFLLERQKNNLELPLLLLLDINMPGMDGFEVLEKIRSNEHFKEIPLCSMLSSSSHPDDIEKAANLGANAYLIKPDNAKEYKIFFENIKNVISF